MVVNVCGYGNSGSSAVIDYIKGYNGIQVFDSFEFQLIHQIDGINDLKYYLTSNKERVACNSAIKRFIRTQKIGNTGINLRKKLGKAYDDWCKRYVDELTEVKWMGYRSAFDAPDVTPYGNNKLSKNVSKGLNKIAGMVSPTMSFPKWETRYFSILEEREFDSITKKYLRELFFMLGLYSDGILLLDMLLSVSDPMRGAEYFDDIRTLIITRDPRDVYASAKLRPEYSRFMPNDTVENFIAYYKSLHKCINENKNVMHIQYEDLIYKYQETTEKIRQFLSITGKPDNEFTYFNPVYSARYTYRKNLYDKYPEDISVIEQRLPQYLYDFKTAVSPTFDTELVNQIGDIPYKGWNKK